MKIKVQLIQSNLSMGIIDRFYNNTDRGAVVTQLTVKIWLMAVVVTPEKISCANNQSIFIIIECAEKNYWQQMSKNKWRYFEENKSSSHDKILSNPTEFGQLRQGTDVDNRDSICADLNIKRHFIISQTLTAQNKAQVDFRYLLMLIYKSNSKQPKKTLCTYFILRCVSPREVVVRYRILWSPQNFGRKIDFSPVPPASYVRDKTKLFHFILGNSFHTQNNSWLLLSPSVFVRGKLIGCGVPLLILHLLC